MPTVQRCDVEGCGKDLAEDSGFEISRRAALLDRSDRDRDETWDTVFACSLKHAKTLAPPELVDRFTEAGKKKRR